MNESEVFLDRLGCLFNGDGRGHDYVYAAFLGKLVHLAEEHIKRIRIVSANLERGIYEKIGNIMVRGKYARDESEKGLCIAYEILIGINQTALIFYIEFELIALFYTNDRTVGRVDR